MTRILLAIAFAVSFMIIFLGVIIALHLDLFTGFLVFGIGLIYFIKYLPSYNDKIQEKNMPLDLKIILLSGIALVIYAYIKDKKEKKNQELSDRLNRYRQA